MRTRRWLMRFIEIRPATIVAFFGRSYGDSALDATRVAVASCADVLVLWIKGLVTKRPLKLQPTWSDVND